MCSRRPTCDDDEECKYTMRPPAIPCGAQTCEYYTIKGKISDKFNNPDCIKGYGRRECDPRYRTTSSEYGSITPNVHTMPTSFLPRNQEFTTLQKQGGMFRHRSLNN